jgi:uncharacterized repeat protein (TIGR02543 family)
MSTSNFCELLNTETEGYYTRSEISHEYLGGGIAWNFHYDEASRTYNLPFDFPFFGETIPEGTLIYVCSNGYVDFNGFNIDYSNSGLELANNKRIAPCWIDLKTDGSAQSGEDVYITENADSLVIRWVAQTYYGAVPVNVELVLYADGRIQFNYDGGNDLSATPYSPTIGISKGDGINCYFAVHNGQKVLTDVDSAVFTLMILEPPSLPVNPSPAHEATDVSVEIDLDWDDCIGATSYDIYFGGTSPPPYVETTTESHYDPGTLNEGTTYYWKVVAKNNCGETPGEEWQFTVCVVPGAFSNLTPSNGASDVSLNADLDWEDSGGATYYDVFFGTASPPPYLTGTVDSYLDVGSLSVGTTYYWRIDAENDCGIIFGEEWSFTTVSIQQYDLTITAGGGGTTDPAPGIYTYNSGTEVTITAQPESEYEFSHWKGDVPEGHEGDNPITITMNSDKSITANFIRQYTLTIIAGEGGTTDPAPEIYTYDSGTRISITALPGDEYRFSGWTGDVPSGHENDNPLTLTMDSNKSITANFIQQYTLTIVAGTGGTTNPSPGSYAHDTGTNVSVTAIPNSGYNFSGWSGDASGTTETITITMDSDKSITASFTPDDTGGGDGGDDEGDGGGGGCFIATAAYGSPLHPHIDILRDFRDRYLMTNGLGCEFVDLYYKYSPFIAERIAKHKILKVVVRIQLSPLVALSYSMVYFGPVITIVVLVFIFAIPTLFIMFNRKKLKRVEAKSPKAQAYRDG